MEEFEAVVAPRILLSDRVIREEGTGKISLIGVFDAFISQTFPFLTVPFFATVTITNIAQLPDRLDVVLRMENNAGHAVASSQAQLTKRPEAGPMPRHANIDIIFPFGPVRFDAPGVYNLVCIVSKDELNRRQFEVRPMTAGQEQVQ